MSRYNDQLSYICYANMSTVVVQMGKYDTFAGGLGV